MQSEHKIYYADGSSGWQDQLQIDAHKYDQMQDLLHNLKYLNLILDLYLH